MEDKKRILKMVEEGKLSSEEAIKLLEALDSSDKKNIFKEEDKIDEDFFDIVPNKNGEKMLYVRVQSSDGSKVKVNIPIEFIKIMGSVSKAGNINLNDYDVDVDKLMEAIDKGLVGRIVEVEDGNDRVIVEIR